MMYIPNYMGTFRDREEKKPAAVPAKEPAVAASTPVTGMDEIDEKAEFLKRIKEIEQLLDLWN